jgi:tRNA(Ile)-lysidine synthase
MNAPIPDTALSGLFDSLFRHPDGRPRRVTLAVSGGSDSTALMLLAARWRRLAGLPADVLDVAVVDHALRAGSAREAAGVVLAAENLGFHAAVLEWRTPTLASLQAAARDARYRLLAEHVGARNGDAVATGHTIEDQAETLLMRLARGSGVDGLAAMRPVSTYDGLLILRPLLGQSRRALRATLTSAGLGWVEDPSNANPAFERVRLRNAAGSLADLGLRAEPLALTAKRLARAREALEQETRRWLSDPDAVAVSPVGYVRLSAPRVSRAPEEIRVRLFLSVLAAVGGAAPELSAVEDLAATAFASGFAGRSLAGCLIEASGEDLILVREPARRSPPVAPLAPGTVTVFDGRFRVGLAASAPAGLALGPAGVEGARLARRSGLVETGVPAAALQTMPAILRDGLVAAFPALADPAAAAIGCVCIFDGPFIIRAQSSGGAD